MALFELMKFRKIKIIYLCVMVQIGCASIAPQTDALLKANSIESAVSFIENVPFVDQKQGYCGPATLAMVMGWAGKSISPDTLADQVFTPGMQGSFQTDMISASRRQGFLAIPLTGLSDLLTEVHAGHPVIVFENLALSWAPVWHYAVVIGYDLTKKEIILHSGHDANLRMDLREFESSWKLGNYWGLIVLPPNQLAKTADEMAHVRAAAGLEQVNRWNEAHQAYQQILQHWPSSLGGLIGAANTAYTQKDYRRAVNYLRLATKVHPDSAVAKHNLAVAEKAALDQAETTKSTSNRLSR